MSILEIIDKVEATFRTVKAAPAHPIAVNAKTLGWSETNIHTLIQISLR